MMDIKKILFQRFINLLIKKFFFGSGIKNEDIPNKELDKILHQPIVRTFNKKKKYINHLQIIFGVQI